MWPTGRDNEVTVCWVPDCAATQLVVRNAFPCIPQFSPALGERQHSIHFADEVMDKQSFGSDNNLPGQDGLAGHLSLRCSMLYITVQSPVLKRFLTVQDNKQEMPGEWPKDQSDASQSPTVAGDFRTQNDTFFLFFDLFYWGIVDLPHCVNFCCISKWFSYIFIYALFQIHFHYDSSQDIDYGSLCYIVGPCLSILFFLNFLFFIL